MRSIPAMTRSELSRFGQSRSTLIILFGIAIIPLLYGGLLIWSNFDPTHRLEYVPAAIVNNDEAVTISVDGEDQVVPLGRTLTGTLTSGEEVSNFDWNLTNADDAAAGLADGSYGAVLTIPENFSAAATSTSDPKADGTSAEKATLSFESNDANLFLTGVLTESISKEVAKSLNGELTSTYLDNIYLGFNDVNQSVTEAADGAGDLQDGANDLADGVDEAADGAGKLATGLGDLNDGASELSGGAGELLGGARRLATGLDSLNSGAGDLAAGASTLSDGAGDVNDGAQQLSDGGQELRNKTDGFPEKVDELSTGIKSVIDGLGGEQDIVEGAGRLKDGANDLADATTGFSEELGDYSEAVARLDQACLDSGAAAKFCTELGELAASNDDLAAGHDAISEVADTVATGATDVSDGFNESTADLEGFIEDADAFATDAPKLVAAIGDMLDGIDELADGTADLVDGANDLDDGAGTLSVATGTALEGATTLRDGLSTLSGASEDLATGASDAQAGSETLASGTSELASGSDDLLGGATTLAEALSAGADEVPSFSEPERNNLSDVVSSPVATNVSKANAVDTYGYGLGPYFMALALWVGAMALYMIVRAIPARAIASTAPTWRIAMAGLGTGWILGVIQATGLVLLLRFVVGVEAANLIGTLVFAILVSATFMAINQALIAALGTKGRFVALVLIVLQLSSAGATYPIETTPGFFQAISNWLPMTHAVNGFRTLTAGGGQGIWVECAWLVGWLLLAFSLTVFAARTQRSWTINRLHPELVI